MAQKTQFPEIVETKGLAGSPNPIFAKDIYDTSKLSIALKAAQALGRKPFLIVDGFEQIPGTETLTGGVIIKDGKVYSTGSLESVPVGASLWLNEVESTTRYTEAGTSYQAKVTYSITTTGTAGEAVVTNISAPILNQYRASTGDGFYDHLVYDEGTWSRAITDPTSRNILLMADINLSDDSRDYGVEETIEVINGNGYTITFASAGIAVESDGLILLSGGTYLCNLNVTIASGIGTGLIGIDSRNITVGSVIENVTITSSNISTLSAGVRDTAVVRNVTVQNATNGFQTCGVVDNCRAEFTSLITNTSGFLSCDSVTNSYVNKAYTGAVECDLVSHTTIENGIYGMRGTGTSEIAEYVTIRSIEAGASGMSSVPYIYNCRIYVSPPAGSMTTYGVSTAKNVEGCIINGSGLTFGIRSADNVSNCTVTNYISTGAIQCKRVSDCRFYALSGYGVANSGNVSGCTFGTENEGITTGCASGCRSVIGCTAYLALPTNMSVLFFSACDKVSDNTIRLMGSYGRISNGNCAIIASSSIASGNDIYVDITRASNLYDFTLNCIEPRGVCVGNTISFTVNNISSTNRVNATAVYLSNTSPASTTRIANNHISVNVMATPNYGAYLYVTGIKTQQEYTNTIGNFVSISATSTLSSSEVSNCRAYANCFNCINNLAATTSGIESFMGCYADTGSVSVSGTASGGFNMTTSYPIS